MILHGYWRSGAAYRVRIGLNLKGLAYEQRPVELRQGEQRSAETKAANVGLQPQVFEFEGDGLVAEVEVADAAASNIRRLASEVFPFNNEKDAARRFELVGARKNCAVLALG